MHQEDSTQEESDQKKTGKLVNLFKAWRERSQQRKQLAAMSDHMLKDIGINRYDAHKEYSKPFWRP